jgi:type IV secretory system conjugative DNA transfer VirD4/TraG family protein/uncharacterized protein DUF87
MSGTGKVLLGDTRRGNPVYLPQKVRSTHMHVLGASGRGKSKILEHLIREDIRQGNGLCLIDPHGYLYDDLLRWIEVRGFLDRRKVILLEPTLEGWTFGFNPLDFGAASPDELSFAVDAMVKVCAQVWGGEDTTQTPLLKRVLRSIFYALAAKRLTLLEALFLTNPDQADARRYITHDLQDYIFAEQWQMFNALGFREFEERFGSANNRLMEFLTAEMVRNIIGQKDRVLDFRRAMDEGHIILVNLASRGRLSDDNARLLGALMVNDLFLKARHRPPKSRPFYLYIDECSLFVNEDIARILDEARKFGLHLVLAHQHLNQLRRAGETIYSAVMTNAQTKVVFGGLSVEDAEIMARTVFMGEYRLDETKYEYDTYAVTGHVRTWLRNRSSSTGSFSGVSSGVSASGGTSHADYEGAPVVASESHGRSESRNSGSSEGESWGESETLQPTIRRQTVPGALYSLEEQVYRSMAVMVNQPTRKAIVKIPLERSRQIMTPEVEEAIARDERVRLLRERAYQETSFAAPAEEVREKLTARRQRLLEEAREYARPHAPRSFRE